MQYDSLFNVVSRIYQQDNARELEFEVCPAYKKNTYVLSFDSVYKIFKKKTYETSFGSE
jgi:hypothetical protein